MLLNALLLLNLRSFLTQCVDPWKDENKSGFHPTYPDIDVNDPETLTPEAQEALSTTQGLPQPDDPDLDRLFLDERHQRHHLHGFVSCALLRPNLMADFLTQDDRASRRASRSVGHPAHERNRR